jgi:hypothetical protein
MEHLPVRELSTQDWNNQQRPRHGTNMEANRRSMTNLEANAKQPSAIENSDTRLVSALMPQIFMHSSFLNHATG